MDLNTRDIEWLFDHLDPDYKNMDYSDMDLIDESMLPELERFLEQFPMMKLNLKEYIEDLNCLADEIDKVHKNCTIISVVANSTGAISGMLTIAGLALVPMTAGGSMILSVTGMGLGAVASFTGTSANIIDHVSAARGKKHLDQVQRKTSDLLQYASRIVTTTKRLKRVFKTIQTAGRVSTKQGKQINKALQGTVLAMTKGARLVGAAVAGISVLMDVSAIIQDSKHLSDGAKAETAEELREKAQALEKKLEELSKVYTTLLIIVTQ
ncbi:apolipoprotein L2-like [Macrotis lagotis]|uniref:apolipoprotein L2-like n=1 Tax=Macrotis lagotis TaxID=92651 RepID=UPI003D6969C1